MRLKGKVAIITGSGSGIGRTISVMFAREGAKVVISDIDVKGGEETVKQVKDIKGEAIFVKADVSKGNEVKNLISESVKKYGKLDVLVNNAATIFAKPLAETTEEEWDRLMSINVKGYFLCAKYAIPEILKAGGGTIINQCSDSGLIGFAGLSAYCTSKGAVLNMTRVMALELAPQIRVNCICPGAIPTPFFDKALKGMTDPEAFLNSVKEAHPLGLGNTEDIGYGAIYLASDESKYVTGIPLIIDGGYLTK